MKFEITSSGISGSIIDKRFGKCSHEHINHIPQRSFPLDWSGYPQDTKSFSIVFIDYDNCMEEGFPWIHWCVANIPAEICSLGENCSSAINKIDPGIIQGKNSWIYNLPKESPECNRYGGPAPEAFSHIYDIQIFALKKFVNLKDGFYYNELLNEMQDSVLAKAVLKAKYCI